MKNDNENSENYTNTDIFEYNITIHTNADMHI